jgi:hypothetical protein
MHVTIFAVGKHQRHCYDTSQLIVTTQLLNMKFQNELACIWLHLIIGSRTNLHSVKVTHNVNQVEYVEPQEDQIFLTSSP